MKNGESDFRLGWPLLQRSLPLFRSNEPPVAEKKIAVRKPSVLHTNDLDMPHPWRYIRWQKAHDRQVRPSASKKPGRPKGNFVYKVIPDEDLHDVAVKHDNFVEVLMEANSILNPVNVAVGQLLYIPHAHQIKWGDTLWSLSRKYGVSISSIQVANGIENRDLIYADDIIVIPKEPRFSKGK